MKRFLNRFSENWILKTTALVMSVVLWLFVRGEPGSERVVTVSLEVRVPSQMEIINQRPSTVEVTMRGGTVSNMWFSQPFPVCTIDLQNAEEGEHVVSLNQNNLKISKSSGIEILQINPARVTIVLEATISKEVPIVVPVQEAPPSGFEVYNKISRPTSVIITGARSRIVPVHEIETTPLSLREYQTSGRFFVNLHPMDSSIRTSVENPVTVQVSIGPVRKLHTVSGIPIVVEESGYFVEPQQVNVRILASQDAIDRITINDFLVFVRALNTPRTPANIKPTVRVLNDFSDIVVVQATYPQEVVLHQKKK